MRRQCHNEQKRLAYQVHRPPLCICYFNTLFLLNVRSYALVVNSHVNFTLQCQFPWPPPSPPPHLVTPPSSQPPSKPKHTQEKEQNEKQSNRKHIQGREAQKPKSPNKVSSANLNERKGKTLTIMPQIPYQQGVMGEFGIKV